MKYSLRPYQQEASDKAVEFLKDESKEYNAVMVCPTGTGKSLLVADIAAKLDTNILVLQPTKEILEQNYAKMKTYCDDCSMYSASVGKKEISKITFAMIGSIFRKPEDFMHFDKILVDECHLTDAKEGMYHKLFSVLGKKVLGLTATPFRLESQMYIVNDKTGKKRKNYRQVNIANLKKDERYVGESQLVFLTNIEGGNFKEIIYAIQIGDMVKQGYLAKTQYYECMPQGYANLKMYKNSQGSDISEKSMQYANKVVNMGDWVNNILNRLLRPKSGIPRKGIIVFTKFVEEAEAIKNHFHGIAEVVSGKTPKREREKILDEFKSGKIKILANVGTLVVGFDYPLLDTIVFARPTLSLAIWYQAIGRVLRPHKDKDESWVVDLCGNYNRFGRVEDLVVENKDGQWMVSSFGKQLTDVIM